MKNCMRVVPTITIAGLLVASGCGSGDSISEQALPETAGGSTPTAESDDSVEEVGGTVSVLGVLGGDQQEAFLAAFAPFEAATGISIEYEGTQDLLAVIQTRLDGGNPPDIVSNPSAGQMRDLARNHDLLALDEMIDVDAIRNAFPAALVDLATANDLLYGIPGTTAIAGLVWYDPQTYDGPTDGTLDDLETWATSTAASGITPFCIGLESGPVSGWPGASWIQQFMLQQSGPDAYNAWWQGDLAWTSPEVTQAFESFGMYATDPAFVRGGPTAALTTSFSDGGSGLFADPPECRLHVQADWFGNAMAATFDDVEPVTDIDFFLFPPADSSSTSGVVTSGETFGAFTDSPQTRAFLEYVASPEFSELIAGSGSWIAPNRETSPEAYASDLSRKAAAAVNNADILVFGAQDGMPAEMSSAFQAAVMSYVADAGSLDEILADLDEIQARAYAG